MTDIFTDEGSGEPFTVQEPFRTTVDKLREADSTGDPVVTLTGRNGNKLLFFLAHIVAVCE